MRILIDDPGRMKETDYRRFIRRAQLDGLLSDYLYEGEPYLTLNGVVLSKCDALRLQRLSEHFATALERVARLIVQDVAGLEQMGFPWAAAELLAAEAPHMPLVGRFDFVQDDSGHWWLLEFNADTPSGIREAVVADRLVYSRLPEARGTIRKSADLAEAVIKAFHAGMEGLPIGSVLGLLTNAQELEDLAQMAFTGRLIRTSLGTEGFDVVLGNTTNLRAVRGGLTLCGRKISALYRYVPFETMYGTPAFSSVYDAVMSGRLRLLNGLFGLLLQHKGLLALLWERRDDSIFTDDERAAIREHLPAVWPIDNVPALRRAELVAKQVFGREGEEVFFGEDCSDQEWEALQRQHTYVVQERVRTSEVKAVIRNSDGFQCATGYLTVGSYVVRGCHAGYYTRFGGKITRASAKWLATFVERE